LIKIHIVESYIGVGSHKQCAAGSETAAAAATAIATFGNAAPQRHATQADIYRLWWCKVGIRVRHCWKARNEKTAVRPTSVNRQVVGCDRNVGKDYRECIQ
jgi:hypothetical protein